MNLKSFLASGAALIGVAAFTNAAHAQSINYGALQQLFSEPVTTSATGSPQKSSEAPVAMEIVTAEDIKRSGATDIPMILSRLTGVDILTWGAGGASDIGLRGYATPFSPRLLVLINGRQVYLDHYGYTAWSTLPVQLSEIRQIEVVRGPNSALFGFNAVSGVVNIITFNPKYDQVSEAGVAGGTGAFGEASLVTSMKVTDQVQTRLSFGASKEDQWKEPAGAVPANRLVNPYKYSANLDTVVALTPKLELRLEGSWSSARQSDVLPTYSYSATKYETDSFKLGLNADTQYGLVSFDAYRNDLDAKYNSNSGAFNYKNNITVVKAQDLLKLGAQHTLRFGAEYRHNELNTQPLSGGKISYDVFAASGMWSWAITDRLSLTAAARYDNLKLKRSGSFPVGFPLADNSLFNKTPDEVSANAGLVYKVTSLDTVRASYARGLQLPSLVDFGGINLPYPVGPFTVAVMGEPGIRPSVVTSYELGYDRNLQSIAAVAGVNVFTQQTDDLKGMPTTSHIDLLPTLTTYPAIFFADNIGSSRVTGVELHAKGKIEGGYHWSANWTFTHVTANAIAGESLASREVDFSKITPKNRGNFNFGWERGRWAADGYVRYVSRYKTDINPTPTGDYTTLAGRIAYAVNSTVTASVAVENALKAHEVQSSPLMAERRIIASLSAAW
jgi:outer membrane receptor for ferrienterochelin and colicins